MTEPEEIQEESIPETRPGYSREKHVAIIDNGLTPYSELLKAMGKFTGLDPHRLWTDAFDFNPRRLEPRHKILVLVGFPAWKSRGFMADNGELTEKPYEPFYHDIDGENRLIVLVHEFTLDGDAPSDISRRLNQRRVLGQILSTCDLPVMEEDVRVCIETVESLGDGLSFWTKKILKEIKTAFEAGTPIAKVELGQLLGSWTKDVGFLKPEDLPMKVYYFYDGEGDPVGSTTNQQTALSFKTTHPDYNMETKEEPNAVPHCNLNHQTQ